MFQWNFIWNSKVLIQENAFEDVVCKNGGHLVSASICWNRTHRGNTQREKTIGITVKVTHSRLLLYNTSVCIYTYIYVHINTNKNNLKHICQLFIIGRAVPHLNDA